MVRACLRVAVFAPVLLLGAAAQAACGDSLGTAGRHLSDGDSLKIAYVPRIWPVPVGRHFALDIEVCSPPPGSRPLLLRVDADMPAHKHGMNYRPSVTALEPGRYRAEGLMFHMPGTWRLQFEVRENAATLRSSSTLEVQ